MNALSIICRSMRPVGRFGILLSMALLVPPEEASALCGLDGAARELLRSVEDPDAARALFLKTQLIGTCAACHLVRFGGPRNEFGNAINMLLTIRDREVPVRQREVGRRMKDILANPSLPNSPTFGELFQLGRYPADSLVNQEPPLPEVPGRKSESLTAEQARELVKTTEEQSRFGIVGAEILAAGTKPLHLGLTVIDSPAVALALAKTSKGVSLPRLQAATEGVITILAESKSLTTPALETIYVLSPSTDQSR